MKILYVDFDGCLNSVGSFIYNNRLQLLGLSKVPTHESFDPIACSNLEYILEECPDVYVVVSSSWRKYHTLEALKKILTENHIMAERIIGTTPVSEDGYRGTEIEMYLADHPEVTEFCIIDDDDDMDPYMSRLVKTDSRNGLTFSDAERVIEMLGGGKSDKKEE